MGGGRDTPDTRRGATLDGRTDSYRGRHINRGGDHVVDVRRNTTDVTPGENFEASLHYRGGLTATPKEVGGDGPVSKYPTTQGTPFVYITEGERAAVGEAGRRVTPTRHYLYFAHSS